MAKYKPSVAHQMLIDIYYDFGVSGDGVYLKL